MATLWMNIHHKTERKVKYFDSKLQEYKYIREKNLPVHIEKDCTGWNIYTDKHFLLHQVDTREKAVKFCRELGFQIMAFVTHKDKQRDIFE